MGGLLWLTAGLLLPLSADAHGLAQAALLLLLISGAIAVYGLLLALFGVISWGEAVNAVRQTAACRLARLRPAWHWTARCAYWH